jgi:hypothetical protein
MSFYNEKFDKIFGVLQRIGKNCEKIEKFYLVKLIRQVDSIELLSSFPNLRKLSLKNFNVLPPSNWTNLTHIEGDILGKLWAYALSILPNLKGIKCESSLISHKSITDFCNLCKGKLVSDTLEELPISATYTDSSSLSDDGFKLVLDTFPNLTAIVIRNANIKIENIKIEFHKDILQCYDH